MTFQLPYAKIMRSKGIGTYGIGRFEAEEEDDSLPRRRFWSAGNFSDADTVPDT